MAVAALSFTLTACGDSGNSAADSDAGAESSVAEEVASEASSASTSAAAVTSAGAAAENDDDGDDRSDDHARRDLPSAVSGYTAEAEEEMADEGVSASDIERVLAAANGKEDGVEIEWDDDGYWEIALGDLDIDIDPNGLVLDVDRDD